MQVVNKILTSALTNREVPDTNVKFENVKTSLLNLVIANHKGTNLICLVVDNRVYFWKNKDTKIQYDNFIYRVEYPALTNLIYICWHEGILIDWLLSKNKPFSTHMAFSPECPMKSEKTPKWKLQCCIDMWGNYEDDDNFTNLEIDHIKPWNLNKTDVKCYNKLISELEKIWNDSINLPILAKEKMLLDINPGFVDLPYKLIVLAFETSSQKLYDYTKQRYRGLDFRRIRNISKSFTNKINI